jgi:general secretion pathway protein K
MTARRNKGAALIATLFIVATMSFIMLAISERMAFASARAASARMRAELLWRAEGIAALSQTAIETASRTEGFRFSADNAFFRDPREIPMDGGGAVIAFRDAGLCFNLNSLVKAGDVRAEPNRTAADELRRVIEAAELRDVEAVGLIAASIDWIDANAFQEPGGAEDGTYASLPAPYRTGGGPLADISELRAMAPVSAAAFRAIAPYVCAQPTDAPSVINVNMLSERDAPILSGLLGGVLSASDAAALIRARPPGGYADAGAFWGEAALAGKTIPEAARARISTTSRYLEVTAAIRYQDREAEVSMILELDEAGRARLISRRIGPAR